MQAVNEILSEARRRGPPTMTPDELLRRLEHDHVSSWQLTGCRQVARSSSTKLRKAQAVGNVLCLNFDAGSFNIHAEEIVAPNSHTMKVYGRITWLRKSDGEIVTLSRRVLHLRHRTRFETFRSARQRRLWAEERERTARLSERLQTSIDYFGSIAGYMQAHDPNAEPRQPIATEQALQMLAGEGWVALIGSLGYLQKIDGEDVPVGKVVAYPASGPFAATLAIGGIEINLDDYQIVQYSPWSVHLRQIYHLRSTRPKKVGGGQRELAAYAPVVWLHNQAQKQKLKGEV